jgi:hypothetical protein
MKEGYIKLHRKILEWEWFSEKHTRNIFIYMLLTANYEDKKWRGITVKRGQLITSIRKLSRDTEESLQHTRNTLTTLRKTQEITQESNSRYTIFTINNYNRYQDKNTVKNTQNNTQINTHTKEDKNNNIYVLPDGTKKTLEEIAKDLLKHYNSVMNKNYRAVDPLLPGLKHWLTVYTPVEIAKAIKLMPGKKFFGSIDLLVLFRRATIQGEKVDYIGSLLNGAYQKNPSEGIINSQINKL